LISALPLRKLPVRNHVKTTPESVGEGWAPDYKMNANLLKNIRLRIRLHGLSKCV